MKTTKRQATLFWQISTHVDYYGTWACEKSEIIENFMQNDIEENLNEQAKWLNEMYDEPMDLVNDTRLVILLGKLYQNVENEKNKLKQTEPQRQVKNDLPF